MNVLQVMTFLYFAGTGQGSETHYFQVWNEITRKLVDDMLIRIQLAII